MQQLLDRSWVDSPNRLLRADQPLVDERHRCAQRGGGGALRAARLQQEEPVVLDRELHVLHVAVVALELADRVLELVVREREEVAHAVDRLRGARAGDDVLALRVDEKLAEQARLARSRGSG